MSLLKHIILIKIIAQSENNCSHFHASDRDTPILVILMLDMSILYTNAYMIKKDYLIRALQNHDSFVVYAKIDLIVAFSLD